MAKDKSKSKGKKKAKEKLLARAKDIEQAVEEALEDVFDAERPPVASESAPEPVEPAVSVDLPDDDTLYELADVFKSFADPTRLRILFALMNGGKCVADISKAACVSQSATSHQLRGMKQAGLVKFTRNGKQVVYSLASEDVKSMLAQGLSQLED